MAVEQQHGARFRLATQQEHCPGRVAYLQTVPQSAMNAAFQEAEAFGAIHVTGGYLIVHQLRQLQSSYIDATSS